MKLLMPCSSNYTVSSLPLPYVKILSTIFSNTVNLNKKNYNSALSDKASMGSEFTPTVL